MIDKCKELAAYARSIRSRIIATILLAVFCAGTVFAAATASTRLPWWMTVRRAR